MLQLSGGNSSVRADAQTEYLIRITV